MEYYQTWRDLLATLLVDMRERERLSRALHIPEEILWQWTRREAAPQPEDFQRLLQALPEHQTLMRVLIAEEFEHLELTFSPAPSLQKVSLAFSAHVLEMHSSTPEEARCWSICTAVLSEAVKQLDPRREGFSLMVLQCMTPRHEEKVRYLREYMALGSAPWSELVTAHTGFQGAESLAGTAVQSASPRQLAQGYQVPGLLVPEPARSALALPIQHGTRIAGCLLALSSQPDYFKAAEFLEVLRSYAALLLLAFAPEDFYPPECVDLQIMPSFQVQLPYLMTFQQRILSTLKTAFAVNHALSYDEAQQYVLGEIAEELAQLQL